MSETTEEIASNTSVLTNSECTNSAIDSAKSASSTISDNGKAPRILCNELIINPHNSKSLEKLDELSSLEREIAKMHHEDNANLDLEGNCALREKQEDQPEIEEDVAPDSMVGDTSNDKSCSNVDGSHNSNGTDKLDALTSGETELAHEDLIAVLKGIDGGNSDDRHNNSGSDSILEGVTIEGEGEYQIMEVIDEDSNAAEDITKQKSSPPASDPVVQSLNKTKTFGLTALTAQEERALALEQIEGLKITHRSRKQDIKPIKQVDSTLDLVSALEADWSEQEDELSGSVKSESRKKQSTSKTRSAPPKATDNKIISSLVTNIVVIPSASAAATSSTPTPTIARPSTPNDNLNSNNSSKSDEINIPKSSPKDGLTETKSEEETIPTQSGFRRTRIIKRKIIWDPDAPETSFSYAKLVKANDNKSKSETILTSSIKKGSTTITPIKKDTLAPTTVTLTKKTQRPTTPKVKKAATDLITEKTSSMKSENNIVLQNIVQKEAAKLNTKTDVINDKPTPNLEAKPSAITTTTPTKRRSQTPVSSNNSLPAGVKKKKVTELDRLMGDEGAVNMLNSLEKLEATLGSNDTKSRPMMRSRAATICEKVNVKDSSPTRSTTSSSPTATSVQTNKGKRTPKARASSSWDYVYKKKKQDFDDSLIIRRRSNSSYSSTTSLNRLSLDGPPASIASNNANISSIKSNDSISIPAPTNENDTPDIPPSRSNHNKSSGNSKFRSTPVPPTGNIFEFAKPETKRSQKRTKSPAATLTNDMKKAAPVSAKRNVRSPATTTDDKGKDVVKMLPTKSPTNVKDKKDSVPSPSTVSDVIVKRSSKVAQILFSTNKAKLSNTFTIQMLHKLVDILDKLAADPDCHVVVIGTSDAHFCQGVDITDLTTVSAEKRKNYAVNLATSVKNYLRTLATYPKPIIAGVNGNLMNLGVIQLALFDIVIASEKSTFEMSYSKMGQTPEGYCIWHNMNKIRGSFKTKLFWLCEKVQSTEAALAGLVNKLTITNKVNDDALMTAKRIASLSVESYRVMKRTVINSHLDVIVNSLDEEFSTIIRQWTSSDCLENLKKYIAHD